MSETAQNTNWTLLSRYRGELMGAATLWIILLHSTIWFSLFPLAYVKMTGYCGVDCFLLLSAVGLYFSWHNSDRNVLNFYRRRLLRIYPSYLIVVILRFFLENTGKRYVVLAAMTLSFWILDDLSAWFIAAIMVLYLLSPLILKIMDSKYRRIGMCLLWAAALLAGWLMRWTPQNLFFVRIPSFLLGFSVAKRVYEKEPVTVRDKAILAAAFLTGTVLMIVCQRNLVQQYETLDWILRWYSVLLFEVPLLLIISAGAAKTAGSLFNRILSFIGSISLEIYLLFEVFLRLFRETPLARLPFEYHGWVYSLIILCITIAAAYAVHRIAALAVKKR